MRAIVICLLALWAIPANAQSWQVIQSDDGGYAAGRVIFPGLPFSATCMARSVQNLPLHQTSWFESTVAPPWHFLLEASEVLIPGAIVPRGDIVLAVDNTGYQLPVVNWNELDGAWQVNVPMADQLMQALRSARRIALHVGTQQAWEVPLPGLGQALDQAQAFCTATWAATGVAATGRLAVTPLGGVGGELTDNDTATRPDPRAVAQGHINKQCNGVGTAGPRGVTFGDIDGDGAPDVLVDWSDVTCSGAAIRPFCGASLCSGDVLLSRNNYVLNEGDVMLGMSHNMIPLDNGNQGVSSSGNLSMCQSQDPCGFISFWDGTKLQSYKY